MIYPKNFEEKIGFDIVRTEIIGHCISTLGTSHCVDMHFSTNHDEVVNRLNQVNEFLSLLQSGKEFPVEHFFDMRASLKEASLPGSYLSESSLHDLMRSLNTISAIMRFFNSDDEQTPYPALRELTQSMSDFPAVAQAISQILDRFGNVKDSASPELKELRQALLSTSSSINNIMRGIIGRAKQEGLLAADAAPSVRDGRLVLPVASADKRRFKGIVHDESATGRTVFIEPAEIVEANNRIRELEADIAREIIRILTNVTAIIRPHIPELLNTYQTLGIIDFVRAKALFAQDINANMPHIERKPQIELYHAVHPALLLALRAQGKEVVPLNLTLTKKDHILVISGPNAGGKSVCLKTVGIIQYMTQCGILPPVYYNSHMSIFKSIFIDIGDQQSIENDLSTYSSHLYNMKTMLNRADNNSLILIDEFGSGTEPQIGAALAQAILHQFANKKVFGIITTHYQNLKQYADDTPGLINGAMLYDRQHMQPLFQLSVGYPGSSFAIEIARKIGISADVIAEASQIVGSEYINMDKYLLDIARDRRYWENKRQEIHLKEKRLDEIAQQYNSQVDELKEKRREIIHDAKAEAGNILQSTNAIIERTIREIRNEQAEKEKTKELRRQLEEFKKAVQNGGNEPEPNSAAGNMRRLPTRRKQNEPKQAKTAGNAKPLAVGDNVTIDGSNSVGEIIAIEGKNAIVAMGGFRTRTPLSKLKATLRKATERKAPSAVTRATADSLRERQLNFSPDIDVRGMRGDEAIQAITYFIDDAIQFNIGQVRILHGTGNGILRTLIRQYLDSVVGVKSYRDEHIQLGGAGITVVQLD
ncbi:MAG: endonuclease MutS2 [Muribaculaceae bacterium]